MDPGSAEELIKQELQAVAEDVVASVFSVDEQKESTHGDSQDKGTSSEKTEIPQKAKFEVAISFFPIFVSLI